MWRNGSERRPRTRWASVPVVVAAAVIVLVGALPASAHNVLRSSSPAAESSIEVPPESISLVFDQSAIALGNVVEVTGPNGAVVSDGDPELTDTTVLQPISATEAGEYQVVWRVTSSDGHPIEGEFGFTVATGAEPSAQSSTEPSAQPSAGAISPTATGRSDASSPPEAVGEAVADQGSSALPWVLGAVPVLVLGAGGWFLLRRGTGDGTSASPSSGAGTRA